MHLVVMAGVLAGPVLSRLIGIAAARADLPVDRIEDALNIAGAIALQVPNHLVEESKSSLRVTVSSACRRLEVEVEALRPGGAAALLAEIGLGNSHDAIARVATTTRVTMDARGERLHIVVDA